MSLTPARDHKPKIQTRFRGLYSRGVSDTVPNDYQIEALNCKFGTGEISSRDGSVLSYSLTNIVRAFKYKRAGETPRTISLDSSGQLWDSLYGSPIYTDATFLDFSMVNYSNRAYITPHNRTQGIAGKSLLVYEGGGTARLAAGVGPTGFTLSAANSPLGGNVEVGTHVIAVCFLTSTGFITKPGPSIYATVDADGTHQVRVSSLPLGGSNVVGRVLIASRSVVTADFTGNQFGYELFFIPGGIVEDNVTTTVDVNFYDADLTESADYLIDNLETIPAGVCLCEYGGRLAVASANGEPYTARVSEQFDPETFIGGNSAITVDPSDSGYSIRNMAVFRGNLLFFKPNRMYGTSDNGSDPSTWRVDQIDDSVGSECFSVVTQLDAKGVNTDRLFIGSRSGLISYEGTIVRPELSYNIEDVWKRINGNYFSLVQVVDDPSNHRLFVSVPLDSATHISHILYADYSEAFTVYKTIDVRAIKWSIWTVPASYITSIFGEFDNTTLSPVLHYALFSTGVFDIKSGLMSDNGTAIPTPYFRNAYVFDVDDWIHHFGFIKIKAVGSGSLTCRTYGEDATGGTAWESKTLSSSPGYELDILINFINEKCSVKFGVSLLNEKFTVSKVSVYCKELWLRRPTLVD